MAPANALDGDLDGDDDFARESKLAARAARFNNKLPGNRYKELEEARAKERDAFVERGMITAGQTDLAEAVDLRGTCEDMCTPYEREFREYTREIHPFEATPNRRIDHSKAVTAYTRSDAGAGHGVAVILPSDLRTPSALVRSLDYLINNIMSLQPPPNPNAVNPPPPTPRRALGYSSGFIRDRTRAIRKEFALQSSWGHEEGIATFERIARWHIICLRELQEETGSNTDMHIDNAELGRCFTSLRQQYNDRREETGLDMPCANEPEFRAYMLIYDLANKSVSIPISELPQVILDHPLVQLAWQIRQAAQRNFDSQKEGSKLNAELGANLITRFLRLLKQGQVPYLMSCLVEVRLREMRRSALRALTRTYPGLKTEPIRRGENGEILERKMILMPTLDRLLGAEEQEAEETAWDDVEPVSRDPDDESLAVVQRFNIRIYQEPGDDKPMGALINLGAQYNDNKDAPFTRRWKLVSDKLNTPYADVVNGHAGIAIGGGPAAQPAAAAPPPPPQTTTQKVQPITTPAIVPPARNAPSWPSATKPTAAPAAAPAFPSSSTTTAFQPGRSAFGPAGPGASASAFSASKSAFEPSSAFGPKANGQAAAPAFSFKQGQSSVSAFAPAKTEPEQQPPAVSTPKGGVPNFFSSTPAKDQTTTPTAPPPPKLDFFAKRDAEPPAEVKAPAPLFSKPGMFDAAPKPSPAPVAEPSKSTIPNFFSSTPAPQPPAPVSASVFPSTLPSAVPTPPLQLSPPRTPPKPVIPAIKVSRKYMRSLPSILASDMVSEVVAAFVKDHEDDMVKVVRQREAAADYKRSAAAHAELLKRQAREIMDELLEEHVQSQVFAEWFYNMRARVLANEIARHWRTWAQRRVDARERAARQREQDRQHLKSIGLARSYGYLDGTAHTTSRSRSARSAAPSIITLPRRSAEPEIDFRETEEMRRKFWEGDSSLFKAIASHVAPLLRPTGQEEEPRFETVLLTAGQSGLPAGGGASAWLSSKLLPPERGPRVLDGVYYHDEVGFQSCATDVQGFFPGTSHTGLYIFEAPLITIDTAKRVKNMDDAGDRLEAAAGAVQQGSRYRTALLILTWETETLEEVVQRLGIERDIEQFEHVAAVSIHNPETFGALFSQALRMVIPSDPRKSQVVLPLMTIADRQYQLYQELIRVADNLFKEFPTEARLVPFALRAAYDLLSSAPNAINEQIDEQGESDDSDYSPPALPPFAMPTETDRASVAGAVQDYMSLPELSSAGGIPLVCAELRDAVTHGRALPVCEVLDALGAYVRNTLRYSTLRLEQWYDAPEHLQAAENMEKTILRDISEAAAGAIRRLGEEALVERARQAPLPPSPTSTLSSASDAVSSLAGMKRQRSEDAFEPLRAKSARLAELLAGATAGLAAAEAALQVAGTSPAPRRWY